MAIVWFAISLALLVAIGVAVFLLFSAKQQISALQEETDAKLNAVRTEADSKLAAVREEAAKQLDQQKTAYQKLKEKAEEAVRTLKQRLVRYQSITDIEAEVARIAADNAKQKEEADRLLRAAEQAKEDATSAAELIVKDAKAEADSLKQHGLQIIERANANASVIVENANNEAKRRSQDAYDIMQDTDRFRGALRALKNQVEGYGSEYVVPIQSVIDELADETAYQQAGQELKRARTNSRNMVKAGQAADCDYSEKNRRETAVRFVTDAFNGKVDSILSTIKSTNVGKVEQKVRDAFALVNLDGAAFRNARITDAYLKARLEEVKWAALAQDVKKQQQEEQRRIREKIREEKKVQREIEKALKTAERERALIEKARTEIEAALLEATEAEKETLKAQLADMEEKLRTAEEQGQRAMSMAQQTKKGNVYIISNIGAFGEGVFKIGLTRRLDPHERVKELGGSSVPFAFDVHALIESEDAPALEHRLHKHFVLHQLNKVNHRKEFFRCDLTHIRAEVESLGLESTWTMAAEAQEYRETLAIEDRIAGDEKAREQWVNRQLQLEDAEDAFADDDAADGE